MFEDSIKCPKCSGKIFAGSTQGRKYYAHKSVDKQQTQQCLHSMWAEDVSSSHHPSSSSSSSHHPSSIAPQAKQPQARVFVSSKKDYVVMMPLTPKILDEAKEKLVSYFIQRNGYIQTGRFVVKLKDTIDTIYKLDFIDSIYDDFYIFEEKLKKMVPETSFKQILDSNLLFAVITEKGQYQVVAEIHYALANNIPVFLKFCNCDEFNAREEYWFTIAAVHSFWQRRSTTSIPNLFTSSSSQSTNLSPSQPSPEGVRGTWNVPLLTNNWKSEKDYLHYLDRIPICCYCYESFSELLTTDVTVFHNFAITDDVYTNDDEFGGTPLDTVSIKSTDHICHKCLDYLRKLLKKYIDGTKFIQTNIVLEFLGITTF
jgi:hypothetical protein